MHPQIWHGAIIAYCLEDELGQAPTFYKDFKTTLPDGFKLGYVNPRVFRDNKYRKLGRNYKLVEYLLFPTALTYPTGEVMFQERDIRSKTIIGGGRIGKND